MSTIIVKHLDGTTYDLDALGFHVKKFDIPMNNYNLSYQQLGKYGALLTDVQQQQLTIPLTLDITAKDLADYNLQVYKLRRIFQSDEDFYVWNSIIPYLRWKCRAEAVTPTQNGNFWRATDVAINLDVPNGYAETVATTQNPVDFNNGQWGFGEGIPDTELKYTYTITDFSFWNLGIIPLNADERPVQIAFKGDAPNGFTLTNQTTKKSMKITRAVSKNDAVVINGLIPSFNGTASYKDCDHGYLDFAVGENKLHIDGASNFELKFDTRFYF